MLVECSGYAYSLALASGEADASFAYECLVFFGPGFDDVGDLGLLGGLLDKGVVDFIYRDSEGYVFLDCAVGQEDGLGYVGYVDLPVAGVVYCDFLIIDFKGSLVGLEQSHDYIEEGAFAAPGEAYKADAATFGDGKVEVL